MPKLLCLLVISFCAVAGAQTATVPRLEASECIYQAGGNLVTRCGYLVVLENRNHPHGQTIKLPYIYVESKNPGKHPDPVLYTGGGPGVSSLHAVTSIARRSLLRDRDYIAFEQRGTHYAIPSLECDGGSKGVQTAYLDHSSIDEAILEATRKCRAHLLQSGVDLSAYNTDESAADIEDLRRLLGIESINLMGISYSGGLMMTVLQKFPKHVRSLILDSPLPEFVSIDEQELANFNEALTTVLDGAGGDLTARFRTYFESLNERSFQTSYRMKDGSTVSLSYGRKELLDILHSKIEDYNEIQELPKVVEDIVAGHQQPYIQAYFDGVFASTGSLSGMRLSVYCSDKMAFEDQGIIREQEIAFPWMAGFHVNDVHADMCNIWQVTPIQATTKKPFYSNVPVLLGAGGLDDACRPLYNDIIHHYFPNSQRLLFTKRPHGPLLNSMEGDIYIGEFLDNPSRPLVAQKEIETP